MQPRVIGVQAREVAVAIEVSLEFLENIQKVIEMSEFNFDSTNSEEVKIHEFLKEEYFPFIEGTIKGIQEQIES